MLYTINKRIIPIVYSSSESEVKRIISLIINKSVYSHSLGEELNEIVIPIKNNLGDIITIDFNTNKLNKKLYDINDEIHEYLYKLKNNEEIKDINYFSKDDFFYYIPYGVITNMGIFRNLGSKIPIKINVVGDLSSNLKTEVVNYGLNNALLKIYIDTKINVKIILPFMSKEIAVKTEIPIVIKMIQGKVPSIYGTSFNTNSSSVVKILE